MKDIRCVVIHMPGPQWLPGKGMFGVASCWPRCGHGSSE